MQKVVRKQLPALVLILSMLTGFLPSGFTAEASATGGKTVIKLTVPQNVHEDNGFIVWDEVEGAYGYTIQAGKGKDTWEYNWYENKIEWNRFIYEHCPMYDFGDYVFQVCAFDETGVRTEFSSPVTVPYRATISMPGNVKALDGQRLHLTWDTVEGAARYNIRIYDNNESHSLRTTDYTTGNSYGYSFSESGEEHEYLVTVQAMDADYHVSEWTEEVLVKAVNVDVERPRLATPQNVRFDESGENIIWDEVEGASGYNVFVSGSCGIYCTATILENWKRYISPWESDGKQHISVYACSSPNDINDSARGRLEFAYTPDRDESIIMPQIKCEDGYITWDKVEGASRYLYRIMVNGNGTVYNSDAGLWMNVDDYPEGDYEIELCVVDEVGKYNSKVYPVTLDPVHDESVWIPKLYHKFETVLWDYDRLRHPHTSSFWIRIRRQKDGAIVKLRDQNWESYSGLGDLKNGEYMVDACVRQLDSNGYKLGKWSEPLNIEKYGPGLYEKENETTTEVEAAPEATDIPEDDRITSITINPAFNMKHKNDSNVELDLSNIKIKAREIYDEAGLKRAEAALGETLNGNKHYNLLDLTLLYNGKDFSNGYEGLVKVIIPLPKGHRDKTFSCYRLTEKGGKMTKEFIPGEQTEDSYIIYLEHFSEYALVAAGPEEPHTHVYGKEWKSDATGHWKECVCKVKAEKSAHTQDAGTVTKKATKTEMGIKTYKCSICGYVIKTEKIAKLSVDKKTSPTAIMTKSQKKKNGIILHKKISCKITENSLTVSWNKLSGAAGYDIYAALCSGDFKGITASVSKNRKSMAIHKINGRKIRRKKVYKVKVKAYRLLPNGKKQYIAASAVLHIAGSQNKKLTNARNIKLQKKSYHLKKGNSAQIRAKIIKSDRKKKLLSKGHGAKISYTSSDEKIAAVTKTGKLKAKKCGSCVIYVRALNGISKKIKVSVK
ncbi:MAG: Ig-like domain-containing protein [Clostridium sp.]|nr:Ig-like domain-containing protein [Clostridium sp.]